MSISNRASTGQPAKNALAAAMATVCGKVYKDRGSFITSDARRISEELFDLGFIIVPKGHTKPARRGNAVEKEPYDPWIGKSHSARLLGG